MSTEIETKDESSINNEELCPDTDKWWLTTIDNPFNPYNNLYEWFVFDSKHGYNSCGIVARLSDIILQERDLDDDELTEQEAIDISNEAIDRFLANDITGLYTRVSPNEKIEPVYVPYTSSE